MKGCPLCHHRSSVATTPNSGRRTSRQRGAGSKMRWKGRQRCRDGHFGGRVVRSGDWRCSYSVEAILLFVTVCLLLLDGGTALDGVNCCRGPEAVLDCSSGVESEGQVPFELFTIKRTQYYYYRTYLKPRSWFSTRACAMRFLSITHCCLTLIFFVMCQQKGGSNRSTLALNRLDSSEMIIDYYSLERDEARNRVGERGTRYTTY